jgi:SAM-dependent methyltransferase
MHDVFPHEVERFGDRFPTGAEYRKHWEVAMAVAALSQGGVLHDEADVLGVGAGNEPTIFHLTNLVRRVYATDLYLGNAQWDESANASMLSEPERHWPAESPWNPRRLVVQHMNALDLKYEDESFDAVFSSSSIEHFGSAVEVQKALAEIHRVLKPGGVASISTEFRLAGPTPGMRGTLMFDASEVQQQFIDPFDWTPMSAPDFEISDATLATEQLLTDLSGEVANHVDSRGFIMFHELDWKRYPHIVLRHGDLVWTSVHLALQKQR